MNEIYLQIRGINELISLGDIWEESCRFQLSLGMDIETMTPLAQCPNISQQFSFTRRVPNICILEVKSIGCNPCPKSCYKMTPNETSLASVPTTNWRTKPGKRIAGEEASAAFICTKLLSSLSPHSQSIFRFDRIGQRCSIQLNHLMKHL